MNGRDPVIINTCAGIQGFNFTLVHNGWCCRLNFFLKIFFKLIKLVIIIKSIIKTTSSKIYSVVITKFAVPTTCETPFIVPVTVGLAVIVIVLPD